jgi:ribonuclease HI
MRVVIHTDGNRHAGGAVAYDEAGKRLAERARIAPDATVPICEYVGLITGLHLALDLGATDVTCWMDAELVQRHVSGEYVCRDPKLQPYLDVVRGLMARFGDGRAEVVLFPKAGKQQKRRYLNGDADALAARCAKLGKDIDNVF